METNKKNQLNQATAKALFPLFVLLDQIDHSDYQMPLEILDGNSIGKHVRHIIEFYTCLMDGYSDKEVNYDKRKRNLLLETEPQEALQYLHSIQNSLLNFDDRDLNLTTQIGVKVDSEIVVKTNWLRELIYNIEHTTHHLAIINIAIKENFLNIKLTENFGVAASTIRYQMTQKQKLLE